MKIIHISGATSWRGGEQQLINLYKALDESSVEQIIFCPKNSALENYCLTKKIDYYSYLKTGSFNLLAAVQIKNICQKIEHPDILHLHDSAAHTIGYLAFLLGLKSPMVLSRKVAFKIKNALFTQKKYNASCIKKIICVSETVKTIVSSAVNDKDKIKVIFEGIKPFHPNGTDDYILPENIAKRDFDFITGYIAALTQEKDHETFLQVALQLIKKGMRIGFLLVGEGKDKKKLESRIQELGLSGHVFLIGFCKEIQALMKRLDVLLFTSRTEGFPITILEAFFMNLPVVATKAGGIVEMVEDGKTGLTAAIGDVEELANKVEMILLNPQLRNELTENAYHFVQQFTYDKMAKNVLKVYNEILEKN